MSMPTTITTTTIIITIMILIATITIVKRCFLLIFLMHKLGQTNFQALLYQTTVLFHMELSKVKLLLALCHHRHQEPNCVSERLLWSRSAGSTSRFSSVLVTTDHVCLRLLSCIRPYLPRHSSCSQIFATKTPTVLRMH